MLGAVRRKILKETQGSGEHKSCHRHSSCGRWARTFPVSSRLGRSRGWWARSRRWRASIRRCWRWRLLLWRRGICKHTQKELVTPGPGPMQRNRTYKGSFFMACEAQLPLRATWGGPLEPPRHCSCGSPEPRGSGVGRCLSPPHSPSRPAPSKNPSRPLQNLKLPIRNCCLLCTVSTRVTEIDLRQLPTSWTVWGRPRNS